MPAYIETLDPSIPPGSEDISRGDDRIRETKRAFIERLGTDHEFQLDETGNNKIGYHKKVTLTAQTDPDPVEGAVILYSKDTGSGVMETFWIDEAGNIGQLTNRGSLGRLSKEVIMWFGTIASIPAGFYLCNGLGGRPDLRDKFIVAAKQDNAGSAMSNVEGTLAQSGSPQHNHGGLTTATTLTVAQIPALTYTLKRNDRTAAGPIVALEVADVGAEVGVTDKITTNAGGGSHDHPIVAATAIPPYYALAMISPFNQ